jgi:hypothetical protein
MLLAADVACRMSPAANVACRMLPAADVACRMLPAADVAYCIDAAASGAAGTKDLLLTQKTCC